ncbi:AAA family ATPase (plasmid) [Chlorogloeopsis fritschii PCC 9212]|uniref:Nuclease SbcCD subunit C n=5 Tax=Chlorogloeopsis fritschii TaxID=1124 RepID=A0A3S0XLA9_CHLFR|nr:SMC family ATPase [Chlorogloeopsis fritschii]RUR72639.1 hypothetical protein PCC6912_61960 [Chlorogloeopsis fritschii PCC 6912]
MIPVRVYVENFMSYREGQELLFDGAPLWVLSGPNGAGKSTIFDAITFALYGLYRGGQKNYKDLINHQADALNVEFDFIVDEVAYRVCRTVSHRGRPTREVFRLIPSKTGGKPRPEPIADTDNDSGFKNWVERTIGLKENAFTSCVLLLQGQSEKLLQVGSTERGEILKQLIDLSPYKRLHLLADDRRKELEIQVKSLKPRLDSMLTVSDAELNAAAEAFNQAAALLKSVDEKVEKLTVFREQSKQWQQLKAQINEAQKELQELNNLLARTEEIERKCSRLRELGEVLPLLSSIINQRQRILVTEQQVQQLQHKCQQIQENLERAESEKQNASNQVQHIEKEIEQLETNINALTSRLDKLAPFVASLSQMETIQIQLQDQQQKLATFPSNLEQLVQQAQLRDNQLVEAASALPWLEQLTQWRSNLADALNREKTTSNRLAYLESQLKECQNQQEKLNSDIALEHKIEKNLSQEVTRAETGYDTVCKQRKRFEKAAHKPTCELCGQEITPEHAHKEKARLDAEIATSQANLNNLKNQHQQVQEHLNQLTTELKFIDQQISSLQLERNQNGNQQNQAKIDTNNCVLQINKAFNNLPAIYQACVSPYLPSDVLGWLDTNYPTDTDLEELSRYLSGRQAHTNYLSSIGTQFEEWKLLNAQIQFNSERLAELEKKLPLAQAQQARVEQNNLQQDKVQQQSQLKELKTQQHQLKNQLNKAIESVNNLSDELQSFQLELSNKRGIQGEIQRSIASDLENLPQQWQEKANTIQSFEIEQLETEQQELVEYEFLSNRLNIANGSVAFIQQQISNFNTQIEQLPSEARRSIEVIELELNSAKTLKIEFDANRSNAEKNFNELVRQREQRSQLEQDLQKVEREHRLYDLLSVLLGKKGLQLQLLRNAERAIVELANEILDGLSRGRMRLELRGEAEESPSESDKALDLQVYDYETGQRPTAVAMTSSLTGLIWCIRI